MLIRKSHYFDCFHCIADLCPDSCCKEWEVQLDPKTAQYYRNLPGQLGERLRSVMAEDPMAGTVMVNENGRCPMWRQDGLCQIQAQLGEAALCQICREYPRLTHDYGNFIELGLELSCPEAARLILSSPSAPMVETILPGGSAAEYDEKAMSLLLQTRTEAIEILESPVYSVPEALILLLFYGHRVQALLDGEPVSDFSPQALLTQAPEWMLPPNPKAFLKFFSSLEILTDTWAQRLTSPSTPTPWTQSYRKLARYGVERYWLQAVSDYDLVSRVKLTVISCLLVRLLGGDFYSTAQTYSKEIENCAENMDALLDAAYDRPEFSDRVLLGLLLS